MDYVKRLLPVVTSRKYVEHEHGDGRYVHIYLVDHLMWSKKLWEHVTEVRINIQVRQSGDTEITDLSKALTTGRFPRDALLPLKAGASRTTAYGRL